MIKTAVKVRGIYADTDAMGIAYHTNYIRWFEIGRTELFRDMGILRIPAMIADKTRKSIQQDKELKKTNGCKD